METLWNTFDQNRPMLEREFKEDHWSAATGTDAAALKKEFLEIAEREDQNRVRCKADLISFLLENARIEVNPYGWFADKLDHQNLMLTLREQWIAKVQSGPMREMLCEHKEATERRAYYAEYDFGHCAPDWNRVLSLGIPGLLKALSDSRQALLQKGSLTDAQMLFFDTAEQVYRSLIRFVLRLADEAERLSPAHPKMEAVAESLRHLAVGAPSDTLEAMQLIMLFYFLQTRVECDYVRSIGLLDRMLYPFYRADLESGRFTKQQIFELLCYFMYRFYAADINSNLPFALGGTDENANEATNELSYLILEAYAYLRVPSPKIHIRCGEKTPEDFLRRVIQIIKGGNNSFVFANDDTVVKALMKLGETECDARNYIMIGCYEPASLGREVPCSCNGQINFLKAAEYAMTGGRELCGGAIGPDTGAFPQTFSEYYGAVKKQIAFFCDRAMELVRGYEQYYMQMNPSPLFSTTMADCLQTGTDVYAGGAKYNNSSLCGLGIANAADAIYTVKRLVYEEKRLSLQELADILKQNWHGHETLRLKIKKLLPKYGNHFPEIDRMAADLIQTAADCINRKPNGRGGVFRFGCFSIDWRFAFGKMTAASADGRLAGETLSKNLSAAIAADRQGVTGLIGTAAATDYTSIPNGAVLDLTLHPTAVTGEAGDTAILALIKTYFAKGGMALQCNVLDPSVLRKAQADPERYATLQVRLCGWNVYFTDLSRLEQDEFIAQAENAL